ncbi:hypothetical protein SAMN05446635_2675 [Burkholderia sp. OK233]|nr:hypothetical protein SAMN05446635_2675 [Burkholderia sp. OK233]
MRSGGQSLSFHLGRLPPQRHLLSPDIIESISNSGIFQRKSQFPQFGMDKAARDTQMACVQFSDCSHCQISALAGPLFNLLTHPFSV